MKEFGGIPRGLHLATMGCQHHCRCGAAREAAAAAGPGAESARAAIPRPRPPRASCRRAAATTGAVWG
ncbi:unnamed protein product [Callosobruchus maculatus]|uniref:Uncharacterized protein n=1 Tax=Callosobruchus maculatus TaxID=64391 RepID=A0A653CNL9_CALMS|nr:unnamed protein product [Callosobruchus maculatus]